MSGVGRGDASRPGTRIAQKFHACTERFPNRRENDRFRDLIDLLLLQALEVDIAGLRDACLDVFHVRDKHSWPPTLTVPASWAEPYRRQAEDLEFSVVDVEEAAAGVRRFITKVDQAGPPDCY